MNIKSNKTLEREVKRGIEIRFPNGMDQAHKDRLAYELPIIEDMGYADYHLVVKDFLEYGRLLGYVPKNLIAEAPLTIDGLKEYIKEHGWKNQGFRIGPGRGSAVGSLVCYLLGITALDPLDYGLLFERFLNPERISMPDIDSDISADTRGKVIEYVQNKYGENAVCGIMTTNAQAPKGSINIAAKYYGLKKNGVAMTSLGRMIAKDTPSDVGTSFKTTVNKNGVVDPTCNQTLYEFLQEKYSDNADAVEILRWARIMEGSFTAYSSHAAGIAISDNDDISEYLPLRWNTSSEMMTTQCNMVQTEENGILKFDFLGLKTLDIITETLQMIEENYGLIIDPLKIDLNDKKVYKEIFATGKTNSVFQFESNGMKTMLKRFKPECFEDLIILVSMFRPGPLQYLDGVIDVKNGKKPMEFICPELEPIIGKTYGAIVYQEQVMEICRALAGFSYGHADQVRRFMSKKKADKLAHERESFVEGCSENKISSEVANQLFDQMEDFAKYAFNKSHAAAYAFNAYITGWLKYYYPAEFFASALNWAAKKEEIAGLVYEATRMSIKVLQPDINISGKEFTVVNGDIRFGLSSVAGVKDQADIIIKERANGGPFKTLNDFVIRVSPDKTVYENLTSAGALDSFDKNRQAIKNACVIIKEIMTKRSKKCSVVISAKVILNNYDRIHNDEDIIAVQKNHDVKIEFKKFIEKDALQKKLIAAEQAVENFDKEINDVYIIGCPEDKKEKMALEKDFLGMYITSHPMDMYPSPEEAQVNCVSDISIYDEACYGIISNITIRYTKKDNKPMAFFTVTDKSGEIEVCAFVKAYENFKDIIKEGNVVRLTGKVQSEEFEDEERLKFIMDGGKICEEKVIKYYITVKSVDAFKVEEFKDSFEDEDGVECVITDGSLVKKLPFKVSESINFFSKNITIK